MSVTTLSSREFDQDAMGARRAADQGPVLITDSGEPTYVLLRHDAYRKLLAKEPTIVDLLNHPASAHLEFEIPRLGRELFKPVDLG